MCNTKQGHKPSHKIRRRTQLLGSAGATCWFLVRGNAVNVSFCVPSLFGVRRRGWYHWVFIDNEMSFDSIVSNRGLLSVLSVLLLPSKLRLRKSLLYFGNGECPRTIDVQTWSGSDALIIQTV